ncbi:hypothetical protein AHF37_11394 [Paragonimus kellicotti]|nr:hypothetical protein AHF37_11394 [Paragonimus kellicotti]
MMVDPSKHRRPGSIADDSSHFQFIDEDETILETTQLWDDCPPCMDWGLQSLCRDGLLTCLDHMTHWEDLDQLSARNLKTLAIDIFSRDSNPLVEFSDPDQIPFSSVWPSLYNEPSAIESVLPFLFRARLKRVQEAMVRSHSEDSMDTSSLEASGIDLNDLVESALQHDGVRAILEVSFGGCFPTQWHLTIFYVHGMFVLCFIRKSIN